ncbi:MAG TPA: hypothetical protein VFP60_13795 [Pseudolabrys sp.]|nr:hypothetical protein [Pseudolabrys sp.]
MDAYSMMVTGAFSFPMAMSGKVSGFINSAVGMVSAKASFRKGDTLEAPNTLVASAKKAVD